MQNFKALSVLFLAIGTIHCSTNIVFSQTASTTPKQMTADLLAYLKDVQQHVSKAWFPPKGSETRKVIVLFTLGKGGEVSNIRVDHSSGVPVVDQAAMLAVKNGGPYRPLPAEASNGADVKYVFDYNVYKALGHAAFTRF